MRYFITGATGFIGRFLVEQLLKREGTQIFALVRQGSEGKLKKIATELGADEARLIPVSGNLTQPLLGINAADLKNLSGKIDHFFHLGAIYDLKADAQSMERANVDGTRYAIEAAEAMHAGCFHHVSSIAVAGLYPGQFTEDMFEQATGLDDPYFRTKHLSEKLVRTDCKIPYRIYRPPMVVGHSQTGAIDKIDGPYFIFSVIQRLRNMLPRWLPLVGIEGGLFNMVPVDYVVQAIDTIAHKPDLNGKVFHLTAERHYRLGELLNMIGETAHAPKFIYLISNRLLEGAPMRLLTRLGEISFIRKLVNFVLLKLDLPLSALGFVTYPVTYDRSQTAAALEGSGIKPPILEDYLPALWEYWTDHLYPEQQR